MIQIKNEIAKIIKSAVDILSIEEIEAMIEIPQDSSMGDYAFPCFKLAGQLHKAPPLIAAELAEKLKADIFAKLENVNAYLNIFIDKKYFVKLISSGVVAAGESFGNSDLGAGRKVIVEYSAPNIAKPFHIGHIRSTVIGNSIHLIYKALGYDVVRINHLGDYGTQFGKMIVAYRRWGSEEELKQEPIKSLLSYYVKFHEEAEKDASLEDEARAAFARLEHGEKEETELWQRFRAESLSEFRRVYDMLGISFDSYTGESFYSDKMPAVLDELRAKGLLKESQGAQIVELEEFGMAPALITKSDGSSLYITRDLAAAIYRKNTYDFDKCIYVVASQQNLHFQQWIKILELMGYGWATDCVHIPFGLISMADGTMSTRNGRVVFLEDVLNKAVEKTKEIILEKNVNTDCIDETASMVGIGAVIFNELANSRIKDYVFKWDKVLNFDGETGPYVQYTHARAASVLRNAGFDIEKLDLESVDFSYITGEAAYELAKLIYRFPEAVIRAGEEYEPSVVTRHVIEIARAFNKFYHDEHILAEDENEKRAKLLLSWAAKQSIKNGLALLGIRAPERM